MVSSQPTWKVVRELRSAGFQPLRTRGSHTTWGHPSGVRVVLADGHRLTSPGLYRSVVRAIAESKGAR